MASALRCPLPLWACCAAAAGTDFELVRRLTLPRARLRALGPPLTTHCSLTFPPAGPGRRLRAALPAQPRRGARRAGARQPAGGAALQPQGTRGVVGRMLGAGPGRAVGAQEGGIHASRAMAVWTPTPSCSVFCSLCVLCSCAACFSAQSGCRCWPGGPPTCPPPGNPPTPPLSTPHQTHAQVSDYNIRTILGADASANPRFQAPEVLAGAAPTPASVSGRASLQVDTAVACRHTRQWGSWPCMAEPNAQQAAAFMHPRL